MLAFGLHQVRGGTRTSTIYWHTWDLYNGSGASDPGGSTLQFHGLNALGGTTALLARDIYATTTATSPLTDGDFVELGYFASDAAGTPSATSSDLFAGNYWIPLTSTTTVGMRPVHSDGTGGANVNLAGEYFNITKFTDDSTSSNYDKAFTFESFGGYARTDTNPYSGANLNTVLTKLDAAVAAASGADGYLALRFYDVDTATGTAASVGGRQADLASATKQTRYNTIASADWQWGRRSEVGDAWHDADGNQVFLHRSSDGAATSVQYELANDTYTGVEIGTGGSNTLNGLSDSASKRTASIAFRDGTPLNLANTGDTIVSNLNDAVAITGDASTARDLTVMARSAGTTYTYTGDISTSKTEIHKIGAGTQVFAGAIDTSEALWIDEGTLTLTPANTKTQVFEYITDDGSGGSLALDNDNFGAHVVELGFVTTTTAKTFSGAITLSDSGTNTLKVGGVTATDFDDHQKFTGNIGDDGSGATLKKTGSGKLTLAGSGSNFTGGVTIADGGGTVDGGIVVAGHAVALGTGTTTIEHGKLSVAGGITVANTIAGQGTNDNTNMKSVIGGGVGNSVGTITNAGSILNIGNADGEIDVVSPGIAHASSMSNGTSDFQVIAGNKDDSGSAALTNSIGTMKINTLGLKSGGVFDWEITDFDGNNADGSDWDVLQFNTLTFDSSGTFDINIYGVKSDGTAGAPSGDYGVDQKDASGFLFLDGPSDGAITWGGATDPGGAGGYVTDYFNINTSAFSTSTNNWYGDWSVYYNGSGDFYLSYSVVPEPSTYVMVTGLLMLPGFQFLRRFRKRKNKGEE